MTIQWLLILITTSHVYLPIMAYDTQPECMEAMQWVTIAPAASLDCVLVSIKPEKKKTPRGRPKSVTR